MKSKALKSKHDDLEVDEVESLDEPLSTTFVHGVISSLSGFVHGDIRCHNIIFSKDTSHLIDFDLAKEDGVGKYPGGYNSSFPERHQHALEYQLMKKEHDRFSLAKIMEKGRRKTNYFDGCVCNRKGKVCLLGFSPSQQARIKTLMDSKQPVKIEDREMCQRRRGQKMEIVLKSTTKIGASPRNFDFSTIVIDDAITTLSDIDSKGVYDRVSVNIKVNKVHAPSEIATGKKKQDIMLVDRSGSVRCVLWEEKIGSLKERKCYFLKNFVVWCTRRVMVLVCLLLRSKWSVKVHSLFLSRLLLPLPPSRT